VISGRTPPALPRWRSPRPTRACIALALALLALALALLALALLALALALALLALPHIASWRSVGMNGERLTVWGRLGGRRPESDDRSSLVVEGITMAYGASR
jgi:hypothetical protein